MLIVDISTGLISQQILSIITTAQSWGLSWRTKYLEFIAKSFFTWIEVFQLSCKPNIIVKDHFISELWQWKVKAFRGPYKSNIAKDFHPLTLWRHILPFGVLYLSLL